MIMNNNRDISIDILRFIALSGIILVHISPSFFWMQLRSFDVPLMVFLSGISYYLSEKQKGRDLLYGKYCFKRFKRLILPVWFYLPLYFLLAAIIYKQFPSIYQIVTYYTLLTDWYVWIIRVFFIIAITAPWITFLFDKLSNNLFLFVLLVFFISFECIVKVIGGVSQIGTFILINVPYIFIFSLGYKILKLTKKQILIVISFSSLIFLCYAFYLYKINGSYILTGYYKYPPRLYYTSYAIAICTFLWLLRLRIVCFLEYFPRTIKQLLGYIGAHSMWIYLWHILLLNAVSSFSSSCVRFIVVYTASTCIVYWQTKLVNRIIMKCQNEILKKNLRIIFIG